MYISSQLWWVAFCIQIYISTRRNALKLHREVLLLGQHPVKEPADVWKGLLRG
uniref:Uncharacterized protein n=1 Tax=Oryza sativa subsp. japonica TaxID=39947 RepID=Q6H555_ORYSJ|nr:hypothetical protein [Oryza sativa Japonica Group]